METMDTGEQSLSEQTGSLERKRPDVPSPNVQNQPQKMRLTVIRQPLSSHGVPGRVLTEAVVPGPSLAQYLHQKKLQSPQTVFLVKPQDVRNANEPNDLSAGSTSSQPPENSSPPYSESTCAEENLPVSAMDSPPGRSSPGVLSLLLQPLDSFSSARNRSASATESIESDTASRVSHPGQKSRPSSGQSLSRPKMTIDGLIREVKTLRKQLRTFNGIKAQLEMKEREDKKRISHLESQIKRFQLELGRPVILSDFSPILRSLMMASHRNRQTRDAYSFEHLDLAARIYSQSRTAYSSILGAGIPFPPVGRVLEILRLDQLSAGADGPLYKRVPTSRKGVARTFFTAEQVHELQNTLSMVSDGGPVPKEMKVDMAQRFGVNVTKINRWFEHQSQMATKRTKRLQRQQAHPDDPVTDN